MAMRGRVVPGIAIGCLTWAAAAASGTWIRVVDDSLQPTVVSGVKTLDNRFVLAARAGAGVPDSLLVKVNADGSVLWERRITGPQPGGPVRALAAAADGTLLAAGALPAPAGDDDAWVARLGPAGNLRWQRRIGGAGDDAADALHATEDGGLVIVGSTTSWGAGGRNGLVIKLDGDGNVDWARVRGDSGDVAYEGVREIPGGGYFVVGLQDGQGLALRLDGAGSAVWERRSDTGGFTGLALSGVDDGFVAVARSDRLVKLSGSGDLVWQKSYGDGPAPVELETVSELGSHYLLGGRDGPFLWAARVSRLGFVTWDRTLLSGAGGVARAVADLTEDFFGEGFLVAGERDSGIAAIRLDNGGNVDPGCSPWISLGRPAHEETGSLVPMTLTDFPPTGLTANDTALTSPLAAPVESSLCQGTGDLPPSEVSPPAAFQQPLRFVDRQTLVWEPAPPSTTDAFVLYRGDLDGLAVGERYGACIADNLTASSATVPGEPAPGLAFFYLVRGKNGAGRGDVGHDSEGTERFIGLPCQVYSSCGELKLGFECAPLLDAETPDPLGNTIFFVPDTNGIAIGNFVTIEGEVVPSCDPLCPFPCIVDNTTELDPTCGISD